MQVANTKEAKYDRGMEERVLLARLHKAKNGGALRRADFMPGRYFLVWCCLHRCVRVVLFLLKLNFFFYLFLFFSPGCEILKPSPLCAVYTLACFRIPLPSARAGPAVVCG